MRANSTAQVHKASFGMRHLDTLLRRQEDPKDESLRFEERTAGRMISRSSIHSFNRSITAATLFTLSICSVALASEANNSPSCRMDWGDVREIRLGGVTLNVPEKLLTSRTPISSASALSFGFFVPDLRPATCDPEAFNKVGWNNRFTLFIEPTHYLKPASEMVSELLNDGKIPKDHYSRFADVCRKYTGDMIVAHELYACEDPEPFYATCIGTFFEINHTCTVRKKVNDKVVISYTFGYPYVNELVNIDRKVNEILLRMLSTRS